MPLYEKKIKSNNKIKSTDKKTDLLEKMVFKSGFFGVKRVQVNLYINNLKKKISELEKVEKKHNEIKVDNKQEIYNDKINEIGIIKQLYEKKISDLKNELENEKNISQSLKNDCIIFQAQIKNLNMQLNKSCYNTENIYKFTQNSHNREAVNDCIDNKKINDDDIILNNDDTIFAEINNDDEFLIDNKNSINKKGIKNVSDDSGMSSRMDFSDFNL